jgi:predicted TIM-barrel fold metal-dependent hydrolase
MRVDAHQHVWTEPLLETLARREALPYVVRAGAGWELHSAGEVPYPIDPGTERLALRLRQLDDDGLDAAIVAISSPIGIEALAGEEAHKLIDAHLSGVAALGDRFAAWGPLALDGCAPADVDRLLTGGCAGISLPAGAICDHAGLESLGPVLERIAAHGAPLFVHPGPGLGPSGEREGPARQEALATEPPWWRALTGYVSQMQAAWLAFATAGRRSHPELTVVFSMLAGGAPLLSERLQTRRGPAIDLRDGRSFYDTSSFGAAAVEAMVARVGSAQLVYGSDRPVLEPLATSRDPDLQAGAARLLARGTTAG